MSIKVIFQNTQQIKSFFPYANLVAETAMIFKSGKPNKNFVTRKWNISLNVNAGGSIGESVQGSAQGSVQGK